MLAEATQFLPRLHVPQPQQLVRAAGEGLSAVGRDGDALDRAALALEGPHDLAGSRVPKPYPAVIAARQHAPAV